MMSEHVDLQPVEAVDVTILDDYFALKPR